MLHTILVIIVVLLAYLGIQSDKKKAVKIIIIALVILGIMQIIFGSVADPEFEITE